MIMGMHIPKSGNQIFPYAIHHLGLLAGFDGFGINGRNGIAINGHGVVEQHFSCDYVYDINIGDKEIVGG